MSDNFKETTTKANEAMLAQPSLEARYAKMLLASFPVDKEYGGDYFYSLSCSGDEEEYLNFLSLFKGKSWNEVNFDDFYLAYFLLDSFTAEGKFYYLPAYLNNFYGLKRMDLHLFSDFIYDLASGGKSGKKYSRFERLSPMQSKLVAMFLVNVANLLSDESGDGETAQRALTNYWGNFLLF
jgi:hypothetical protein